MENSSKIFKKQDQKRQKFNSEWKNKENPLLNFGLMKLKKSQPNSDANGLPENFKLRTSWPFQQW